MKKWVAFTCLSIFAVVILLVLFSGKTPEIRITNGSLLPCPSTPNCVSSQAEDEKHRVPPIPIPTDKAVDIRKIIVNALNSMKGVEIFENGENQIHAVFKSKIFRFKDDVDFLIDKENGCLHIRSASRIGYSDFGVNRERVEKLRTIIGENLKYETKQ